MSKSEVEVQGTLRPDGTLVLDEKPDLPAGRVKVVLQALPAATGVDTWAVLEEIWAERKALGLPARTGEEIAAELNAMRDEWEEHQLNLERLQEEAACQGEAPLLIYLDASTVINLIEQPAGFGPRASARVAALLAAGDKIVVSDLTRLECRATPLAAGDTVTLGEYDRFFASGVERVVQLTTAVVDRATEIRGHFRFKAPDSLHLAAAVESGCQVFLTNDARLGRFTGLAVEVLP